MRRVALLAADVGGTKTDIALGECPDGKLRVAFRQRYPSAAYADLDALVDAFLREASEHGCDVRGGQACLAVAGPVQGERATLTNLPWRLDAAQFAARHALAGACIVNDFEAVGHGLAHLADDETLILQPGVAHQGGTRAVIGAGTGLGVAWLTMGPDGYRVHPTEGGHVDFAPADALQDELLASLRHEYGHVSYERLLSGSGLVRIFQFLMEAGRGLPTTAFEAALQQGDDAASVISSLALAGRDPLAMQALDLFVAIYGAYAGSLALATLPRGGLYVAGGIAPRIADKLEEGGFMTAFRAKGRFEALLASIPVAVVMNPAVGLYGAFEIAARRTAGR